VRVRTPYPSTHNKELSVTYNYCMHPVVYQYVLLLHGHQSTQQSPITVLTFDYWGYTVA
jgi:hypothetical protein